MVNIPTIYGDDWGIVYHYTHIIQVMWVKQCHYPFGLIWDWLFIPLSKNGDFGDDFMIIDLPWFTHISHFP